MRTKLGFLVKFWSKKRVEKGRKGEDEENDLKFSDLIKFIEFQAEYFECVQTVLGDKAEKLNIPTRGPKEAIAAFNAGPQNGPQQTSNGAQMTARTAKVSQQKESSMATAA